MCKSPQLTLRLATAEDATALSVLAKRCFSDTFRHLYTSEDLDCYTTTAYDAEKLRGEIGDPHMYTVLMFSEGETSEPCGYSMLYDGGIRPGDDGPTEDYFEVKRFYVDKPFHGSGAAQVMMDHVMEVVRQKNRKVVWLGVWVHNYRAQRFYQKYGFVETGKRMFDVGQDANPDLVYTLEQTTTEPPLQLLQTIYGVDHRMATLQLCLILHLIL